MSAKSTAFSIEILAPFDTYRILRSSASFNYGLFKQPVLET